MARYPHPAVLPVQACLSLTVLAALEGGCFCNQSRCRGVGCGRESSSVGCSVVSGNWVLPAWQVVARSSDGRPGVEVSTGENVEAGLKWGFQPPSPVLPLELRQAMVASRQAPTSYSFCRKTTARL